MAFRLHSSQQALVFQVLEENLEPQDAVECQAEILNSKVTYSLLMLDLSKVKQVNLEALKILSGLGILLQQRSARVMVVGDESLIRIIREQGYTDVLPCYSGVVSPALSGLTELAAKPDIDVDAFLKMTLPAVRENFKTYGKLAVDFGELRVCEPQERPEADIAGVGGFFCGGVKGNLMLCFKKENYFKVVSSIMKKDFQTLEPVMSGWSAELVNSILGRVKSDLRGAGYTFSFGIPTVFVGKDLEVFYSAKILSKVNLIRCTGTFGEFFLELMLTQGS